MTNRFAALVPMRHHSERVPGKNYRTCAGRPLFHHVLSSLLASSYMDCIVVDTDSAEIISGIEEQFPTVRTLERPDPNLADADVCRPRGTPPRGVAVCADRQSLRPRTAAEAGEPDVCGTRRRV